MKYLLDTCTFLWIINNPSELSKIAQNIFLTSGNQLYLSTISIWEITIKYLIKKLPLSEPPSTFISKQYKKHAIKLLEFQEKDIYQLEKLPTIHHDPFDRMLICQAIQNRYTILTPDKLIQQYSVKTTW